VEFKDYVTDRNKESFENALNAYFIIGKLGGFNSLNLQTFFAGQKELSFFKYTSHSHDNLPACIHELGHIEAKKIQ